MEIQEKTKNKSRKNGRKIIKGIGFIFCVIAVIIAAFQLVSLIGNKANTRKMLSFETVSYENQLVPTLDENENYTFVTDRDFKIVQLTDIHIGAGFMSLKKDANALNAIASMLTQEKPDLVIVTGDIAYPVPFQSGTINNKRSAQMFAELMERLGIYWTLCFGNHDTELYSLYDREEMANFYMSEKYSHCLLQKGSDEVDGMCNHVINVKNTKGIITQSLFILDSHAYTDGDYLGIKWKYDNIHENQIEWYKTSLEELRAQNESAYEKINTEPQQLKSLIFFHIPPTEMRDAWNEYVENGYKDSENVKAVYGFAGGSGKIVFCGAHEDELFETALSEGSTQGIFFGHDHRNNISFDYKGVRLTYAMSIDYLAIPGINKIGRQRGCTVINVMPDGSFDSHNENYYQEKYASVFEKESVELQEITYPYNGK